MARALLLAAISAALVGRALPLVMRPEWSGVASKKPPAARGRFVQGPSTDDTPAAPDVDVPAAPDVDVPETPSSDDMPNGTDVDVPEAPSSDDMPNGTDVDVPEAPSSDDMPNGTAPDADVPEAPDVDVNETTPSPGDVPGMPSSDDMPEGPGGAAPEMPSPGDAPAVPDVDVNETTPSPGDVPGMPSSGDMPKGPGAGVPETTPSSGDMPEAPPGEAPGAPTPEDMPGAPGDMPDVGGACDDIGGQLGNITGAANNTLMQLNDRVLAGTQDIVASLGQYKDAASAAPGSEDSVADFEGKLTAMVADQQDTIPSMQDDVVGSLQKQTDGISGMKDQLVGNFDTAQTQVAGLGPASLLLQVNRKIWPFSSGKSKDAFDKAEAAVIAANTTLTKVVDAINELNASAIDTMTGQVLGGLETVTSQFQKKCEIVVTAQSDVLPEVLAQQATTVCSSANSIAADASPIVDSFVGFVGEKIAAAQASTQSLYGATNMLMAQVQQARAAAELAKNTTR